MLFWLIWWAWTQFTWTLSPADTGHTIVRGFTLAATAFAFVMAASVTRAFADDPFWFAIPYVLIRLVGLGLQVRIDHERAGEGVGISMTWIYVSLLGLVVVLAGAAAPEAARAWVWLGAIAVDLVAAALSGRNAVWDLDPRHFSERNGLFVIIALGESLIVAGTATASDERTADLVLAAGAALAVACLLWWTYFGWLKEAMEDAFAAVGADDLGGAARDAYSLGHFPLVCGIIGFAVAVEEVVAHPETPMSNTVVASLLVGIGLFIGASCFAFWRLVGRLLVARLVLLAVTLAVTLLVSGADPVWPFTTAAIGLLAIVLVEERTEPAEPASTFEVD